MRTTLAIMAAAAALAIAAPAHADDIFLCVDSPAGFAGDASSANAQRHCKAKPIALLNASIDYSIDTGAMSGTARRRGAPVLAPLLIDKSMDSSSMAFRQFLLDGQTVPKATLFVMRPGASLPWYKLELRDVVVQSVSASFGEDGAQEHIELAYSAIAGTYDAQTPRGESGTKSGFSYDVAKGTR